MDININQFYRDGAVLIKQQDVFWAKGSTISVPVLIFYEWNKDKVDKPTILYTAQMFPKKGAFSTSVVPTIDYMTKMFVETEPYTRGYNYKKVFQLADGERMLICRRHNHISLTIKDPLFGEIYCDNLYIDENAKMVIRENRDL